jgi:hypothetical protein
MPAPPLPGGAGSGATEKIGAASGGGSWAPAVGTRTGRNARAAASPKAERETRIGDLTISGEHTRATAWGARRARTEAKRLLIRTFTARDLPKETPVGRHDLDSIVPRPYDDA